MFEPWIGTNYQRTRLLILGESAYDWQVEGRWFTPQADHCSHLVKEIIEKLDGSNFMKVVSRSLSNCEVLDSSKLTHAWNHVAFTNYVPCSVGRALESRRPRPSPEQWHEAKSEFKERILERLKPLRLIVLGLVMWEAMPKADYGDGKGAQAYRLATGDLCWCLPLRHPAHGLDWRSLAAAIYFYAGDNLKTS